MTRIKPIGIDLGTTFSVVAYVDEQGRSVVVHNTEGDILTPSIVLFSDQEVVVGKDARSALFVNPDLVAEWVKRDMGSPYYARPIHGQYLPPEVIQACILRKLKADIARTLTPDPHVVITVPAYFDEPRRKATADAGEMAGLRVLDIVNEPTAAALAFGETLGYLTGSAPKAEMTVLVFDLGGGTFDSTLLKLAPGNIQTIATDGDVQLGGHDWDLRLLDHLADSFQKMHGADPRQDAATVNRMLSAVIDAKHALSARSRTTVRVDYVGRSAEFQVTRELFAELTGDLLERTAYTTRQLVADAKLQWKDVSRVLLVGGSTRMPMVIDMLRKLTGMEPDRTVNPDEAVARGAALYAAYLLGKQGKGGPAVTFEVTNVNSHSLGIEGIDAETLRKTNVILIPRNTSLPAKFTDRFVTKTENQRSIVVQVLEGESSLPGECTAIGRTVIRDLPGGLPKGWPIEVTFEYGSNGRLTVRAVVPGTHQAATLDLERAVGLSNTGIAHWKQPISAAAGFEAFEAMVQEALNLPGAVKPPAPEALAQQPGTSQPSAPEPAAPQALGLPSIPLPSIGLPKSSPQPPSMDSGAGYMAAAPDQGPIVAAMEAPAAFESPATVAEQESPITGRYGSPAAGKSSPARKLSATSKGVPRWVLTSIGYLTSAILGLGIGYLLLKWLRPDLLPW